MGVGKYAKLSKSRIILAAHGLSQGWVGRQREPFSRPGSYPVGSVRQVVKA
jgi:hypothetical protein